MRTDEEITRLREANAIVAEVLTTLADMVEPGLPTIELDRTAEQMIRERGGVPSFLGYHGYPNSTCISVDEVIVHGIPGARKLKANQIVSMDVGVYLNGYHGDAAVSVACGALDTERRRLMDVTDRALAFAIAAAKPGNRVGDIGRAVQAVCEPEGFGVVKCFVGHGIGTELHEEPQIPNYDTGNPGPFLRPGMVLAIEPMVNAGTDEVTVLDDGWTAVTADGRPSCHFEHSVVVREGGGEILSRSARRTWGQWPAL